jgi:glycosyltransferase involved in cell wall biosynthesis
MKKILVVGMFDSIHFARWLSQFNSQSQQILILPSSRFRRIHPNLDLLLQKHQIELYSKIPRRLVKVVGYIDYLKFELVPKKWKAKLRGKHLKRFLDKNDIDILHLIELQHAGYMYLESECFYERKFKVISTNYGSDLIYFMDNPYHKEKLERLLRHSDFYSAECRRDYKLARELGFSGLDLPLMPNAGGFDLDIINRHFTPMSDRKTVYVKGYGGKFGLGKTSLSVARKLLDDYADINVVVVSLTDDLRQISDLLIELHKGRVQIFSIHDKLSRDDVLTLLGKSLICIGASQSDGISTTFLEALVSGAIPIQTNTSCANEWLEKGFYAKVVPIDEQAILDAAIEVLDRPSEFESHARNNVRLSDLHLSFTNLCKTASYFYALEKNEIK